MKKKGNWSDHYTYKAKKEKWPARSVYKLEEIDHKHHIIKKGDKVLDLGCYPGSWSKYCLQKVGPEGEVIGIDFKKPEDIRSPNFVFFAADVLSLDLNKDAGLKMGRRDIILSDMAPQTTGMRISDASRSMELARKAFETAFIMLKEKGHFLCKLFENEEINHFRKEISNHFERVFLIRPKAVRRGSRELYVLGLYFKNNFCEQQ